MKLTFVDPFLWERISGNRDESRFVCIENNRRAV